MSQARHTGKIVLTPPAVLDPQGTVLITGGTGMLGGLFAEHLITGYGARRLLLTSRRGASTPEAVELAQRLQGLGADVTISACDCANPSELAALIGSIPAEHPLTAVIHAAGVLDDAVTSQLTAQQLDNVLAAKADSAWYLHQLTANTELAAFVLFSSAAGVLGAPGQANYAAANAVLDALARERPAAISLAWGYWQPSSGMTGDLDTRDRTRLTRSGMVPITAGQGLALFDAALSQQHPNLIPAPLGTRALSALARENSLPPILSALVTARPQAAAADSRALAARLAGLAPSDNTTCWPTWSSPPPRRCWHIRTRRRWIPSSRSKISASTRSVRWSCATPCRPKPGWPCRPPSPSTTPAPRCSPPTSPTCCASPLCPRVRRPRSPRVTPSRWTIGSRTWIKPRSWGCGQDTCRCCR
ncbi:hypothetical protein NIIDMKKI_60590 [Mycobacterium kansasii]|uniref:Ketoreductase domain-containing protein n=1 Tax=Mycobacterium kansasii TaxID=1768 RepID=A0A7G1ILQ1_MYCKA|nr:hypothetical protein NIIDMKKI_60590 [Mycobacterium kansasii]